jgi:hypothetical protein
VLEGNTLFVSALREASRSLITWCFLWLAPFYFARFFFFWKGRPAPFPSRAARRCLMKREGGKAKRVVNAPWLDWW